MAKDTEKLIRQLSLISFLMAERRPVSALEIKQDVEGYSEMNDDAFARRFYADRAELEGLGISLKVEKPPEGYFEAELYTLPPENFYLPPIEFDDSELAALQTALSLLDGRFAYAEPLRLALQQLSWGRPSPLATAEHRSVAVAVTASAGGRELSQRLAKVETAISRRKTIEFELLLDRARRALEAQGRPLPPALPGRPVLPRRLLARARRHTRLPALAHQGQDLLRQQGRARLLPARRLRPLDLRPPRRLAARRPRRHRPGLDLGADLLARRARLRPLRVVEPVTQSGKQWRAGSRACRARALSSRPSTRNRASSWRGCSASASTPGCWSPTSCRGGAERLVLLVERHSDSGPDFVAEPARRRAPRATGADGSDGAAPARRDARSARSASRAWWRWRGS